MIIFVLLSLTLLWFMFNATRIYYIVRQ